MRETQFIKQNKKKWASFERNLERNNTNPDELSNLFIEITDDLSYSRTFYPNRSVRVYLNNIAQKVFYSVYKNRRSRFNKFLSFWTDTVPQVIYESRNSFFFSLFVFLGAALIGAFSAYMDIDFVRVILGDDYVNMTYQNIENGTPMAVYQDPEQTSMFLSIASNNLMVASLTFLIGLFFGVGTVFILIRNGVMLGAFQYLFISEGVYMDSFFTIWMHGAIEISCIVIAGAAGLTMGGGLVFPGTLSRLQSLQMSARRGLLIMLTVLPLIILAAFIEGFITRYTDASYVIRGIVIFGSFAFIVSYYIVYPILRARKGFQSFLGDVKLPYTEDVGINYKKIKTVSQLFSDAFILYRQFLKPAAIVSFILASVYTAVLLWANVDYDFLVVANWQEIFENPFVLVERTSGNVWQFLFHDEMNIAWWLNLVVSGIMAYLVHFWVQADAKRDEPANYNGPFFLKTVSATAICIFIVQLCMMATEGWLFLLLVFVVPMVLLVLATVFDENINILSGLGRSFSVIGGSWVVMMGGYLAIVGMSFIFLFMATAPISAFYLGIIVNAFPVADLETFRQGFYIFLYSYLLTFLFPLVYAVMGLGFYSFRETKEAGSLFEKIENVGVVKTTYGMEKEM